MSKLDFIVLLFECLKLTSESLSVFVQYQLEDEKKKFEENRQAHESMLKSLQSSNRESVIGKEEA
jgi:hypothetical protein